MKNKLLLALSISAAFGLYACGDENVFEVSEIQNTGMDVIAAGEKMPSCSAAIAGKIIYAVDSAAVYYCVDGGWSTLNGLDGEPGKDGEDGEPGKGADGEGCTAKKIVDGIEISCAGVVIDTLKNGEPGQSIKGARGNSCFATQDEESDDVIITCETDDGIGVSYKIKNGVNGKSAYELSGTDKTLEEWLASLKGSDGKSCSTKDNADGSYTISCEGSQAVTIKNGTDGKDFVAVYDTVTTQFLNQEMLAAGTYGIFVDKRDNKLYRTIEIGSQTWMAQNLDYRTGGVATYCYDNDLDNCKKFGALYTWSSAMNLDEQYNVSRATDVNGQDSILRFPAQGICPSGWHVADTTEWNTLRDYVSAANLYNKVDEGVGTSLKSKEQGSWNGGSSFRGSDRFGFSGVGTGRYTAGDVHFTTNALVSGHWWTSNENIMTGTHAHTRYLAGDESSLAENTNNKSDGRSVRCLKN